MGYTSADTDPLAQLVEEADEAFWAIIAARYPGWAGDVDPVAAYERYRRNRTDVEEWIEGNRPVPNA